MSSEFSSSKLEADLFNVILKSTLSGEMEEYKDDSIVITISGPNKFMIEFRHRLVNFTLEDTDVFYFVEQSKDKYQAFLHDDYQNKSICEEKYDIYRRLKGSNLSHFEKLYAVFLPVNDDLFANPNQGLISRLKSHFKITEN